MTPRALTFFCLVTIASISVAAAQSFPHLSVDIEGTTIGIEGGERPNTGMSTGPLVIGEVMTAGFAKDPNFCGFGVASRLLPGAISGWTVAVTPLKVENDAVTFRLQWVRARFENRDSSSPSGDLTVTMKPGDSMPIDVVPLSSSVTMPYERCGVRATALRVSVNAYPIPQNDRRLVSTELWLVERLPGGQERSQALTVRGLFNRATPFYFDSITDGGVTLDFHGEFTVSPSDNQIVLNLTTRSRAVQGGTTSISLRDGPMRARGREVDSMVRLTSGEVVAIELPRLSENDAGAFANHSFSIRVRSQRIR
ncbi:MAG: hypothetical protein IT183_05465 [Acidobacteria bacterium]|nr:hypothetical protein [Acidobacteriota bacterium]